MGKLGPHRHLIREMWKAGATDVAILDALAERGVEVSGASLCLWRKRRGMAANDNRRGRRPRSEAEVKRMCSQAKVMSVKEIASYWGYSRKTIWAYLSGRQRPA